MAKIEIITLHKSLNYGAVLQAYALVKKLRNLGYDVKKFDYRQCNYSFQYAVLKLPLSIEALKNDIFRFPFLCTLVR